VVDISENRVLHLSVYDATLVSTAVQQTQQVSSTSNQLRPITLQSPACKFYGYNGLNLQMLLRLKFVLIVVCLCTDKLPDKGASFKIWQLNYLSDQEISCFLFNSETDLSF
jgi:hypothetical protein